ncbi:hypothetical protein AGABI2DRAFT_180397 [Agaricus bisporus var. bisporus H97]|uniref:hypothetical protein n=1 Tax=Agaricus bisporus var. bisporus (strain H97 / ATCC MYA-4626 / FGSC 10389) TaxID=936046 RepID=UPI00029F5F3A|nr:hypothetical protein AGABI2DRAFT_180397 [Agaricus bisporus var. bisporus H97]EKV43985.1 hypothetical protein AGABI2DRAFT_180397 [Agaricus bisporus var. bisporus H97]
MFKLIRRISYSVIPRPDRPWEEDPTSNAPTRRKRRISSTEPETTDEQERGKKKKRASSDDDDDEESNKEEDGEPHTISTVCADNEDGVRREGSVEIKFVTEGVKEVELDDKTSLAAEETKTNAESLPGTETAAEEEGKDDDVKGKPDDTEDKTTQEDTVIHPESIPLPGEDDESDDLASSSRSSSSKEEDSVVVTSNETTTDTPVESPHVEPITEESTTTSSPDTRPPRTRASTSPRKRLSQSPQKLFTAA